MKHFRLIIFTLLVIIFSPLIYLIQKTYGDDSTGKGWYQDLWDRRDIPSRVLALFLYPFYYLITAFLTLLTDYWEKLGE